jgi:metal-dependent amidase/aminoacylase/carboxypeptidase family protein
MKIAHPEVAFHERLAFIFVRTLTTCLFSIFRYAHDLLTGFMLAQGFKVTQHYLGLNTAWRAEYAQGKGGRTIGINSEMDALPVIGHACGHNLIAISGVGVAIALKAALQAYPHTSGKIVLLGTPGNELGLRFLIAT